MPRHRPTGSSECSAGVTASSGTSALRPQLSVSPCSSPSRSVPSRWGRSTERRTCPAALRPRRAPFTHSSVSVDGVRVETTSNHPASPPGTPITELDPRYVLDPMIAVPAGARIDVGPEVARGWVDVYDLSQPAQRLYELDLGTAPSMPDEPGTYYLEFSVGSPAEEGALTVLVPLRVVAPEDS
jgi:hypothetical protein